jgi:hypothetical protein
LVFAPFFAGLCRTPNTAPEPKATDPSAFAKISVGQVIPIL